MNRNQAAGGRSAATGGPPAGRSGVPGPQKETWIEQSASFIGFLVYLLILKTFFLPLFIIPTGSMAETLYGAHAVNTCPNCGLEYAIGWQEPSNWPPPGAPGRTPFHPQTVQCPNCRWLQLYAYGDPNELARRGCQPAEILRQPLRPMAGDRILVHGWFFDRPLLEVGGLHPQRWDVVVFKVPTDGDTNYIKRLLGLPGEKLELINGDVFINNQLVRKPPHAQRSLWFPYYNQDYPPRGPSPRTKYHPRWVELDEASPWAGLDTRVLRFDGLDSPRAEIQFATDPRDPQAGGRIQDLYAYNEPRPEMALHVVSDVRLSAEVDLQAAGSDGCLEFVMVRGPHQFCARLSGDGTLKLQHVPDGLDEADSDGQPSTDPGSIEGRRQTWGQCRVPLEAGPLRLSLSHVDGVVVVEVNERTVLESSPVQYTITPQDVLSPGQSPTLRLAAQNLRATLRHVLIERDVYYTSDVRLKGGPGLGVQGRPIQLGPEDYFMLGDNSPNSLDARFAYCRPDREPIVAPHLKRRPGYQAGVVPRDQMIGRAFFVYWPGFMPLTPWGPNILVDLGRARWIR